MDKIKNWIQGFTSVYIRTFIIAFMIFIAGVTYLIYYGDGFQNREEILAQSGEMRTLLGLSIIIHSAIYFITNLFEGVTKSYQVTKLEEKVDNLHEMIEELVKQNKALERLLTETNTEILNENEAPNMEFEETSLQQLAIIPDNELHEKSNLIQLIDETSKEIQSNPS